MRHRVVSLSDKGHNFLTYSDLNIQGTNSEDISKMKKILQKAIVNELTERQRYCICEFYLSNRSVKSIAAELNVNSSTVSRHIKKARLRLQRVAKYY